MDAHSASPDPLRTFLRERLSPEQIRNIASADYDNDGDGIAEEFHRNLDTGLFSYSGEGNPYECALLQTYSKSPDRPLYELFGAWWIGAFCSEAEHFVLIDNLVEGGVDALMRRVIRGCAECGADAALAAKAALPFVHFVRDRTPFVEEARFPDAIAALDQVVRHGSESVKTPEYIRFMEYRYWWGR